MAQLLPHEFILLSEKINELESELKELGGQLGEMMRQSSETWHDNGPAQAIEDKSGILSSKLKTLLKIQKTAKKAVYSSSRSSKINIGSTVIYTLNKKKMTVIIVGDASIYENEYPGTSSTIVSSDSRLGKALIGHKAGDIIILDDHKNTIRITTIDQEAIRNLNTPSQANLKHQITSKA